MKCVFVYILFKAWSNYRDGRCPNNAFNSGNMYDELSYVAQVFHIFHLFQPFFVPQWLQDMSESLFCCECQEPAGDIPESEMVAAETNEVLRGGIDP